MPKLRVILYVCNLAVGLGKDVKNRMRQKFADHFEDPKYHEDWLDGKISAGAHRLLYATWLSEVWKEFYDEGG